jgi:hypothetical protein
VLVTGKAGLHVTGTGAKLRLRNSVVAAGTDALHVEPGETARPRLNVQCFLERVTVAARQAVLHLGDAPRLDVPAEPVVVQARASAFLGPFAAPPPPTLLAVEGNALARGLLVWQGEGSVYDRRLGRDVAVLTAPQRAAAWARLGGRAWERQQQFDLALTRTLDWDKPQLDALALPLKPPGPGEERPGADLEALGLVKKPGKPTKPSR